MYGDCQVLTSGLGGGTIGGISSDALFPSSAVQNPNFSFMSNFPFHSFSPVIPKEEMALIRGGKEEMDSGSGSEHGGVSGNEQDCLDQFQQQNPQKNPKKKRYHRHTARQIQEMETLFKECPHPDDKQRLRLSQELGLSPRQVKFWFQNRRTQMKAQQDRGDNVILRSENENLRNENYRLQAALRSLICTTCGDPPGINISGIDSDQHQLRLQNARLKEEFERVCSIASKYSDRPQPMEPIPDYILQPSLDLEMNIYPRHFPGMIPMSLVPTDTPHFFTATSENVTISDHKERRYLNTVARSFYKYGKGFRVDFRSAFSTVIVIPSRLATVKPLPSQFMLKIQPSTEILQEASCFDLLDV